MLGQPEYTKVKGLDEEIRFEDLNQVGRNNRLDTIQIELTQKEVV
ncbi:MAG: hypothetical protein PVF58_02665 [Candidatus Methanofastidiosia archaeon]|jgi:hypothetical protein